MKKIFFYLALIGILCSCSYLDVVPDDAPKLENAFKNENTAEGFVFSCYSYIPQYNNARTNFSWLMSNETVASYHWGTQYFSFLQIQQGLFNASTPVLDIWGNCYSGIRQCHLFLQNIDKVKPLTISQAEYDTKKQQWLGEINFLLAYYHYILLQNYGPIVIVDKYIPGDAPAEDFFNVRRPYDECVDYISAKFDLAITNLPPNVPSSEFGKPTKSIAQALKSRMYIFAASPLFNGNSEFYSNFKNKDGQILISQSFNKEKWKKAMDETQKAIEMFEGQGGKLYTYTKTTVTDPFEQAMLNTRWQMVDPWNSELIWGYSGIKETAGAAASFQTLAMPRGWKTGTPNGGIGATLSAVELFYTKNGLPADKDPTFDWANRFTIAAGDQTIKLNRNREPRFYAYIGFDKGDYELGTLGSKKQLLLKAGELNGLPVNASGIPQLNNDHLYSGYAIKKGIHPNSNVTSTVFSVAAYPYPIIRLAELYLNYAEACAEYTGSLDANGTKYVDVVRKRAGIPTLSAANGTLSGNALIEALHREKMIEFMFEGHSLYDLKRWKKAETYYAPDRNGMRGLYSQGKTNADFYKDYTLIGRPFIFERKFHLFPISQSYININHNLVQNPGW
jgi:hypothetical protein